MSRRLDLRFVCGISCILILLAVGFSGCGGNPPGPDPNDPNTTDDPNTTADGLLLLPATDAKALDEQVADYVETRRKSGSIDARQAFVGSLADDPQVHYAELSDDGYTVWVKFKSGYVAAVNTAEGFGNGAPYDMAPMRDKFEAALNAKAIDPAARPRAAKIADPYPCSVPKSRKILLMSPAAEEFAGMDLALFDYIKNYLVHNRGWSADDIVIKYNREDDDYGTLKPDDFFDLQNYGVVVICAHAITREVWHDPNTPDPNAADPNSSTGPTPGDPFGFGFKPLPEHHYYIQVASLAGGPSSGGPGDPFGFGFKCIAKSDRAKSIDWDAELRSGRIVAVNRVDVFKKTSRGYLYMRDDLWEENLNSLPNSFVYLVSSNGSFDAETDPLGADPFGFGFKRMEDGLLGPAKAIGAFDSGGLASFLAWDDLVSTQAALDAVWIVPLMALNNTPDADEWTGGIFPITCLTTDPDPGPDPGDPFGFGFKRAAKAGSWSAELDLCPFTLGVDRYLFLPAWASIGTMNVPSDTISTSVEILYNDPNLPTPDPNVVEDVPHVGKEFDGLIPGQLATFRAKALDAAGDVLAEKEKTVTLQTGANTLVIHFQDYGIIISASPDAIPADGTTASTVTAILKKYTDTDLVIPTGDPVPGKSVIFATTHGELVGPNPVDSAADGTASIQLTAETDGVAQIKAVATADSVESDPVNVVCGDPEYNVVVQADPPVVVFDYGDTAEIVFTATARYCLSPGEYPPTGNPVVGKEFDWSTSWHWAELVGANPGVTDPNGQFTITVRSDKDGGGDMLAFNATDAKGGNANYIFKWTDPEWYPATLEGKIVTDPNAHSGGWNVFLRFDKKDPAPREYEIFGYNFNDTAYYGHSLSFSGPPFPRGWEEGNQWCVSITSGGGSWDPNSGTDQIEKSLEWGLSRFEGGIFVVRPVQY